MRLLGRERRRERRVAVAVGLCLLHACSLQGRWHRLLRPADPSCATRAPVGGGAEPDPSGHEGLEGARL